MVKGAGVTSHWWPVHEVIR